MMKTNHVFIFVFLTISSITSAHPWSDEYHTALIEKVRQKSQMLHAYPSLEHPIIDPNKVLEQYPEKVLVFGYGSLINQQSALKHLSPDAVKTSRPAVAFGLKRVFNFNAMHYAHQSFIADKKLEKNEAAALNVIRTVTYCSIINGVAIEVNAKDLDAVIFRENGYDIIPVLIADWQDLVSENPDVKIHIAYAFMASNESRGGVKYTSQQIYPLRFYLDYVQQAALLLGQDYFDYWNATTYLSDENTLITEWDKETFSGTLP